MADSSYSCHDMLLIGGCHLFFPSSAIISTITFNQTIMSSLKAILQSGKQSAPLVSIRIIETHDIKNGSPVKRWVADINIGCHGFQTAHYKSKACAISEALGYIQAVGAQVMSEMKSLGKQLEEEINNPIKL